MLYGNGAPRKRGQHILMLDGVCVNDPDTGQPTLVAVDPPTDQPLQHLIEQAADRLIAVLESRGVLGQPIVTQILSVPDDVAAFMLAHLRVETLPSRRQMRVRQNVPVRLAALANRRCLDVPHRLVARFPQAAPLIREVATTPVA